MPTPHNIPPLSLSLQHRNALHYGMLGFPLALLGIPLYLYLPNYYHQSFSMSLALIGSALLAARLFDVLTDPFIGWLSDRLKLHPSRFLQRQWQIILGIVFLSGGTYQLFFPSNNPGWGYLFIWSFITYLGWTLTQVPHQAMNAEISSESLQKTRLASYREAFAILGVMVVIILPALLGLDANSEMFYQLVFLLLLVSAIIGALSLFFLRQDRVIEQLEEESHSVKAPSLLYVLSKLWREHRLVFSIMPSYFTNNLANAIPATLFMIFVSDYLELSEYTGLFLLTYFIAGIVALPVWFKLAQFFNKYEIWQASMLLASLSFIGVFTLQAGDWLGFLFICILTGLSLGIDIAMPTSIQADLTQDVLSEKLPTSGLLFGIWGMLTKLSLALAIGISFPLLDWAQNNHFIPQVILLLLYAAVPILLKIGAWWLLVNLSDQSRYKEE
ncbi:MFS transporter [Thiosulfatimonas sediminis]|uniref:MFS transporter n=1 Tax=Thiosulfatimonas sediminis TaxID=2675054 RepID=A0A6F8PXD9_9GAMM|nr:MFS transporter [Thiosulfatimonas sediminis]BBP46795.1 MFS transporter [Thiosulfatimonas sediminis]